ncbi:hypothetical protein ACFSUS_21445 [Spirosoma soli]|uniref:Uncharacterized protein n=1 Tax=Spirosoma soli TaxID=1770529 RepID=A0ABW5M8D3_9BACT
MKTLVKSSLMVTLLIGAMQTFASVNAHNASAKKAVSPTIKGQSAKFADTCIRVRSNADGTKTVTRYSC